MDEFVEAQEVREEMRRKWGGGARAKGGSAEKVKGGKKRKSLSLKKRLEGYKEALRKELEAEELGQK